MIHISLQLVFCLVLGLGLLVWRARPENPVNRSFGTLALLSAIWILGVAFFHSGTHLSFWAPLAFAAVGLIPATFLTFVRHYPTPARWPGKLFLRFNLSIGLLFAVISLTTRLIVSDATLTPTGPARETGPLYPLYATYFLVTWFTTLAVFISKWTQARGLARVQLHYLGLGFALASTRGIITNLVIPLLAANAAYTWLEPHFALVFVPMAAHAIIRHRLMDVRLVIHRGLTFALALVVSLIPVGGLLALAWPKLSDHLAPDDLVALILAVVVVSLLIPLTRDAAGRLLDRYVYRTHVNYQRTLREASEALTRVLDLKMLLPFLNHTVVTSTNSEGAAVYLEAGTLEPGSGVRRAIAERRHAQSHFDTPDDAPIEVITALTETQDLLLTDEIAGEQLSGDRERLYSVLERLNWALVLPLVSANKVIGAIVVGPKLSGDPFYPQDLDLLMTLAI